MTQARVPVFTLGERITKAYKDLGWKQDDLADRMGVNRKTVGNWIAGRHWPSYADLVAIAQVTGVSVTFFTEADPDPRTRAQAGERASTEIVRPIHRRKRDDRTGDTHQYVSQRDYVLSQNVTVESRYARVA